MLGLCLFFIVIIISKPQCIYGNIHTEHSYYISPNKLKWSDANHFCTEYCGSQLASIHSIQQQIFSQQIAENTLSINTTYGTNNIWIGIQINNDTNISSLHWNDSSIFNYNNLKYGNISSSANNERTPLCLAIDINSDYEWILTDCTINNRFMCNSCDSNINKYIIINDKMNYTNAEKFCYENVHNSSLASIHNYWDYQEVKALVGYDESWHTFIGLNDLYTLDRNFTWTDGTSFDYGKLPDYWGLPPWRPEEPNNAPDGPERCVAIYQEQRWWNDISCMNNGIDHKNTFLCNMPSEICYPDNWLIMDNSWDLNGCNAKTAGAMENLMILTGKEFMNTNGELVVQYMFGMDDDTSSNLYGVNGVRIYTEAEGNNLCSFYAIYVSNTWIISLIKHENGKTETLISLDATSLGTYYFGVYYELTVIMVNNTWFTIQLNEDYILYNYKVEDPLIPNRFDNTIYSGYIGLYSNNLNITVKSLFVSGSPINRNFDITYQPSLCPTVSPTITPTSNPTFSPTYNLTISPRIHGEYGVNVISQIEYDSTVTTNTTIYTKLTNTVIVNIIRSMNISLNCSYQMYTKLDENNQISKKLTINSTVWTCNDYVRDEIIKNLNISFQTNFFQIVDNQTTQILNIGITFISITLNTIKSIPSIPPTANPTHSPHSIPSTTTSSSTTINTLYVKYPEPVSKESNNSIWWTILYMIIGAIIMGLICLVIYLICYIRRNKIKGKHRSNSLQSHNQNSVQISIDSPAQSNPLSPNSQPSMPSHRPHLHHAAVPSQSLQIPQLQYFSSDNDYYDNSDMKRDHESPIPPNPHHPHIQLSLMRKISKTPSQNKPYHKKSSLSAPNINPGDSISVNMPIVQYSDNRTVGNSMYIENVLLSEKRRRRSQNMARVNENGNESEYDELNSSIACPDGINDADANAKLVALDFQNMHESDDDDNESLWQVPSPRANAEQEGIKETTTTPMPNVCTALKLTISSDTNYEISQNHQDTPRHDHGDV